MLRSKLKASEWVSRLVMYTEAERADADAE